MAVLRRARTRHGRARPAVLTWLGAILALALAPQSAPAEHGEYEVKAAFLLNFARLIEWPGSTFTDDAAPLSVALLGPERATAPLAEFLDGREASGRLVRAERIGSARQARGHHAVYLLASADTSLDELLAATRGAPILLVGETEQFARQGGTIRFFERDSKIRFEVNQEAAQRAGLRVSSRLLRVATLVSKER